ncbi:MAG: sialidase family protein [Acidimicrobiales bacterium]
MAGGSRIRIVLAALAAVVVAVATAAGAEDDEGPGPRPPVVTAAVQVTTNPDPTRAHSSPQIARNPGTGELVVVETDLYGDFGIDVHVSSDGGRTWAPGGDPMTEPHTWASDYAVNGPYASVAFDYQGVLYVAFTAADPDKAGVHPAERPRPLFVARSEDSGRTFATTVAYPADATDPGTVDNRRARIAVDSQNPEIVYVSWVQRAPGGKARALVAASTDSGRTFGPPVDLAADELQGGYEPRVAVGIDGVVHAVYPGAGFAATPDTEPVVRPVFYRHSRDLGVTWSPPVVIDEGSAGFAHNSKHVLVADPVSGDLYLAWYGSAKARRTPEDDNDIYVRSSRDGGRTWGGRVTVNDDATRQRLHHYDPGISIAPNGRVDVAWYDFRNSPSPEVDLPAAPFNQGGMTDVYYASSSDEGRTFGPNVRISDRMADRSIGVWSNNVHSHHNVGIASADDAVYFAWQDTRNGNEETNAEDVYFASLLLDPDVALVQGRSDVPALVLTGAGIALGMGVAMLLVALALRTGGPAAARQPAGAVQSR